MSSLARSDAPTYVSLFAGIGGLDLGFDLAGWECAGQVEIEPFCQRVLAHHWPEVDRHDDVRTAIDWWRSAPRPRVDAVIGGFPCQDVSLAGKRVGLHGQRTGLFFDALDFADEVQAPVVVLENVPGLLSSNGGRDFLTVLDSLAVCGFDASWSVVAARDVGAPHIRKRLFVIASHPARLADPERVLRWPAGAGGRGVAGQHPVQPRVGQEDPAASDRGGAAVADTGGLGRFGRSGERGAGRHPAERCEAGGDAGDGGGSLAVADPDAAGQSQPRGAGAVRAQGGAAQRRRDEWSARWDRTPIEPALGEPADGLPSGLARPVERWERGYERTLIAGTLPGREHNARLKALGNAVVPQVAHVVARRALGALMNAT